MNVTISIQACLATARPGRGLEWYGSVYAQGYGGEDVEQDAQAGLGATWLD